MSTAFFFHFHTHYIYHMEDVFEKIYSAQYFERLGTKVLQELSEHLKENIHDTSKTINWNLPENELRFWESFLIEGNKENFFTEILKRTTHVHHPKYIGHQVAAPVPITALTGMVSSLLNNGMAVYEMGMAPSAIERVVVDAVCKQLGYDSQSGGFLTSGGSLANLTAMLAARQQIVDHDVWNEGFDKPLGIMVCEEAHYCVDRAAKIMGLGEKGLIKVPTNKQFQMDISRLEDCYTKATSQGIEVFCIIGSAPSTATGAHDNLDAIAKFAKEKQLWFHVDGAHGGAAIYSDKYRNLLNGIEQADSVVIDGHKMLMMPTITTALLFKNKWHAQQIFNQKADYLLDDSQDDQWYQSGKKTFECTKTMMSLHWFILLKYYGAQLFDDFVTRQYNLAREFAKTIEKHPHFELATNPMSNIVCFRYVRSGKNREELNTLNAKLRATLLEDGEYYLVQTKLKGVQYLRTSLMNPFTTIEHLKELLQKMVAIMTNHQN